MRARPLAGRVDSLSGNSGRSAGLVSLDSAFNSGDPYISEAKGDPMARTNAIVLGAGIVGTSIALHLAKRGLSVALIDRAGVGEQTSYGNAGVIEGNTVFPPAFPSDPGELVRIALKRASEANYHLSFLPQIA